jgi:teichuronic acid biosynthesis glycosyltransferase TuaG
VGGLVSIITPAYNAERFIGETIRSVQAQDYDDWEMLIVDDGSSDNTCAIVRDLATSDSRIRLMVAHEHGRPWAARNLALIQARSRYVAFLDSEDIWLPHKLSTQMACMKEHKAGLVYSAYEIIDENGDVLGKPVRVPATLDYHGVLKNTIIACLTVLVDREQSGPLKMLPLPQQEDLSLWCRILKRGVVTYGVQEVLARYRVVRGSASRNKIRSALHMWKFYRRVEHLSLPYSCWCYGQYAWRGYWKNRKRM